MKNYKKTVEKAGGIFVDLWQLGGCESMVLFKHPKYETSLCVYAKNFSLKAVKDRLKKCEKECKNAS